MQCILYTVQNGCFLYAQGYYWNNQEKKYLYKIPSKINFLSKTSILLNIYLTPSGRIFLYGHKKPIHSLRSESKN